MGILVQREFLVDRDDRREFERQSRMGVWPGMLFHGSLMVAYGSWAFGGASDCVITNSVYPSFDHWTATRGWGEFNTDAERAAERSHLTEISAGRPRLIESSRARIIEYVDEVSEPQPRWRELGEPTLEPPATFGRRSVVSELTYDLQPGAQARFLELSRERIWPWLAELGGRLLIYGRDPLGGANSVLTMFAFRSIEDWHRLSRPQADQQPPPEVVAAWEERHTLVNDQRGRILMVQTDFGTPV
jgi:hypothetical protein